DDGRRRGSRAPPRPAGRRGRPVARLLQLRHVPRLRAPRRGVSRRRVARRRAGARRVKYVKPPVKRAVTRRIASPGAAALRARADAEDAPPRSRIKAGALEVWAS